MATLTETAHYTRKALKYGAILFVSFLIFREIFMAAVSYWKKTHPPPAPSPTVCFGKLPSIKFPDKGTNPPFYPRLETIENILPGFPPSAKVYFLPQQTVNLFTWERSKNWARQLGFSGEPEKTNEYNHVYKTSGVSPTVLKTNVLTGNFSLFYNYLSDYTLTGTKSAPSKDQALSEARAFLQRASSLTQDLAVGSQKTIYFKFNPPNLETIDLTLEPSGADLVLVNFFRSDLDGLKVMPPNPYKSLVSLLISGSPDPQKRILEVNYTHFLISESQFCTYPLKTIDQAWQELKENKTYLASFGQNFDGQVVIRKVYLGYFDPPEEERFLKPIYVFEGDREFIAYVSALDPQFTE